MSKDSRETSQSNLVETIVQDFKYAFRTLRSQPGFTAAVVLTLSLGIGANTAIFSLVDAVLLRMLPVEKPGELYTFGASLSSGTINDDSIGSRNTNMYSYPMYRDMQDHNEVFSDLAALSSFPSNAYVSPDRSSPGAPVEKALARLVSGNFFSVLGVNAVVGRTFTSSDDEVPGGHPVAVVSYGFWAKKFGKNPSAIGSTILVNGTELTILGVTPPEFHGVRVGRPIDIWVPMMMQASIMRDDSRLDDRDSMWLRIVGRLKPPVSTAQAGDRTDALFRELVREEAGSELTPEIEGNISQLSIEMVPFAKGYSGLARRYSRSLLMLTVVVGLVLLIACANVGNLLLARASGRHREVALRFAIGSSRGRLLRQLLTESVMLGLLGGALGLLLARWAIDVLLMLISSGSSPIPLDVRLDGRVLAFTALVSLVTAMLFGLVPALHATRLDLMSALRNQGSIPDPKSQGWRLRKGLVISQVAVSLLLLIGAGLFLRSLQNLRNLDTGFRSEGVLLVEIDPRGGGYTEEQLPNLYEELVQRIEAVQEVRSASLSLFSLFSNATWRSSVAVDGYEPQTDEDPQANGNMIVPGYFDTVGIPIVSGRKLESSDREGAPLVAVVNETFAKRYLGDRLAIGGRFGMGGEESSRNIEVVGVVQDLKYNDLREETPPLVYFPVMQNMTYLHSLEVKTSGDPAAVTTSIRQVIQKVAGDLPIVNVTTLGEQVDQSLRQEKLISKLTSFFGLLALTLASIGVYGVLAFGVAQRTNEIGIRMALGARRYDVVWMILKDGTSLVAIGVGVGIVAALGTTHFVSSLLFGLTEKDPVTLLSATAVLIGVSIFAGYLPARRASRLDPLEALRYE